MAAPPSGTKEQYKLAAKLIAEGRSIRSALLEAGFSESMAKRGRAAIADSWPLRTALKKALRSTYTEFADIGSKATPEEQEALIRGRLITNVINGVDSGYQSTKLLGQDKRVNMFTPDVQIGQIVVVPPKALSDEGNNDQREQGRVIDASTQVSPLPAS